jgi:outer membrane protein insertion porin family
MKKSGLLIFLLFVCTWLSAQTYYIDSNRAYTLFEYNFIEPAEYTIKSIQVEEATNRPIPRGLVVLYSGLSIGQKITIPGSAIPAAIENLWKQEYFSDVQVYIKELDTLGGIVVNFVVREQPRLEKYKFIGVTQSQAKSLKEEIDLKRGKYITPNLLNRTRSQLLAYFHDKGYYDCKVDVQRLPAYNNDSLQTRKENYEVFHIVVDKGEKVKVQDFVFVGNSGLTDKDLRRSIKKIKRRYHKINIFASSKFIETKFEEEKENILKKYQARGFRDARILKDSVANVGKGRVFVYLTVYEGNKYYFRNISWKGNIKYRTSLLDTLLSIKKGDVFNQDLLNEKLFANPSGFDVQSLYMDDGYLFFNMTPVEVGVFNDSIDLEIRISEGPQAKIGKVSWTGNTKTNDRVIVREIRTRPGDIFSRAEIQRTMRDLAALGLFDPATMNVNPKPNPAEGTVDIEYLLTEKPSDQIELSGGWGGNGFSATPTLLGTAGVVLNNFSTRKLFKPKSWNPVPTGDGQKLSLRAQSNGSNYQGYTFSFTEPWLGGNKPNSFSVSLFHTVNSFDFKQRTDPGRQVFFNTGVNLSLGKRLKWPDDFFSLQYSIGFQQYKFQNLNAGIYSFPSGFNGSSYNASFNLVLARTSISDPIYPTSGSSFTFSFQGTPPYSLLNNKDYSGLTVNEKYKWAEFYKWKLDAEWHTTLWKKLVLTTKARFGFLGYYNPKLGLTFFERFQVGGAGLFGFNIAATEIISQRGYDNYTISQTAMGTDAGAPIFNKFTAELRYAVTQSQTATVYGLVFAEAGDAWQNVSKYNPFQLKRAAGAGVRLFMPMFGLIGLDWAYGFDYKNVPRSGKPGQIHFFIGQQF